MNPINLHELKDVMARVFVNTPLPSDIAALKYGDFDEWDSLGNFSLLLSIENQFGIRFTMDQLYRCNPFRRF